MSLIFDLAKIDAENSADLDRLEERYDAESATLLAFYNENESYILSAREELIMGSADGHNLQAVFWSANRACRMYAYQDMLSTLTSGGNRFNTDGTLRTSVLSTTLNVLQVVREELAEAKMGTQYTDQSLQVSISGVDPDSLR